MNPSAGRVATSLAGLLIAAGLPVRSATPIPVVYSVVNAASFQPGPLAPGEIVTLFGDGIGPETPVAARPDGAGRFPISLDTTRVLVNGLSAPLLYVSSRQVTAVLPFELEPGVPVTVRVDYQTITSAPQIGRAAASSPALFLAGRNQVAALNEDGSANSAEQPASPGSIVALFVSGGGRTAPASVNGVVANRRDAALPVTARIGGVDAEIVYAGAAPGLVAGIFQVNVRVPEAAPSGNSVFVSVNIGGSETQAGATIAVANGSTAVAERPSFDAMPTDAGIQLTWPAPAGSVARVRIERSDAGEVAVIPASTTSWYDTQVRPGQSYTYRLRCETDSGYSDYAPDARVVVSDSYLAPPERASAVALSSSSVLLTWTNRAPADGSIVIERSTGDAFAEAARVAGGASAWRDTDVAAGRSYSYRVRSMTARGASAPSQPANASTPSESRLAGPVPRVHPADPHRLTLGGATWTLAGYYPSVGAFTTDTSDYTLYRRMFDALAANGVNYFRIVFTMGQPFGATINPYRRTGPGNAQDGRPKFDLAQFDQSYFDYWREIVQYAQSKGIVVQLAMMDGWHATKDVVEGTAPQRSWGLRYDYYYAGNNVNGVNVSRTSDLYDPSHAVFGYQKALVRKIVDTLGDLPNLVWEIANESAHLPWELLLADEITAYERSRQAYEHLVIPRDLPGHEYVPGNCDNAAAPVHDELVRAFPQSLVLITDNDCTPAVPSEMVRAKTWAAFTAGAQISFFHFEMTTPDVLAAGDTAAAMRAVGLQRKFVSDLEIELAGMVPLDGDVSNGWALGRSGAEYIIYLPAGGETSVRGMSTTRRAVWFNPRDGSTSEAGSGPQYRAPDGNDWVLYLLR